MLHAACPPHAGRVYAETGGSQRRGRPFQGETSALGAKVVARGQTDHAAPLPRAPRRPLRLGPQDPCARAAVGAIGWRGLAIHRRAGLLSRPQRAPANGRGRRNGCRGQVPGVILTPADGLDAPNRAPLLDQRLKRPPDPRPRTGGRAEQRGEFGARAGAVGQDGQHAGRRIGLPNHQTRQADRRRFWLRISAHPHPPERRQTRQNARQRRGQRAFRRPLRGRFGGRGCPCGRDRIGAIRPCGRANRGGRRCYRGRRRTPAVVDRGGRRR